MIASRPTTLRWLLAPACFLCVAGAVYVGGGNAASKPNPSELDVHDIRVVARSFRHFNKSGEGGSSTGKLSFRGGLVLSSKDPAFGGFSGLEISPDGERILAVSDAGIWLSAELVYRNKRPAGLTKATVGPLLALGGKRLRRGRDRDAEALRLINGDLKDGTVLAAFERNDRIGFFQLKKGRMGAPARYLRPPRNLRRNKGIEAVAVIRKGRLKGRVLAFAERTLNDDGHHRGWLWIGKKAKPIALTNVNGFDITDAVGAYDGGLYILERRFRWAEGVKLRIHRIASKAIKPGAVLDGEVLLTADLGQEIDNMEGLAVHRDKRGRTILTLISDNNFNNFLQRTLLLQFVEQKVPPA